MGPRRLMSINLELVRVKNIINERARKSLYLFVEDIEKFIFLTCKVFAR